MNILNDSTSINLFNYTRKGEWLILYTSYLYMYKVIVIKWIK
jgi:hypothetical protein